jgi:hypothetical protein
MNQLLPFALCLCVLSPSAAGAEEPQEQPQTEEQWLKALRGSDTYREGRDNVSRFVDQAYDLGAIAGASHWDDMNEYYAGLARAKGCETGKPFADGPVKACHRVEGPEPKLVGRDHAEGMAKAVALAEETSYPDRIEPVLVLLYDYGYVQGLKHGIRVNNESIRLRQTYFRACMARANGGKGEPACAEGAKTWTTKLLDRVHQRVETHALPARSKPAR